MMKAPLPLGKTVFEISRIELYQLLGSDPEACFDDLIGLAAQMSGTPIAFLSLIDASRHWLKSQLGIDRTLAHRYLNFGDRKTPAQLAISSNSNSEFDRAIPPQKTSVADAGAIAPHTNFFNKPPAVVMIRDASTDVRFAEHPLIVSDPFVKFYAGIPVVTSDGHTLGMLCVMDSAPKDLTKKTIDGIEALARQVASLVELRWQLVKAQKKEVAEVEDIASDGQQISELARRSNQEFFWAVQTPEKDKRIFPTTKLPMIETGKISRFAGNFSAHLSRSRYQTNARNSGRATINCRLAAGAIALGNPTS